MSKESPPNSPIALITASLARDEALLTVLQIVNKFVTHPFDATVGINRKSVSTFLMQLSPRLPSNLKERILRLADTAAKRAHQRLVKVTELTPSSDDPHNITRFLADGGIGRVWVADDEHLGREVVLKQLLPRSADNSETRSRFVHEAQITGQLQHPNIVPVYSMDRDADDAPFYTMRYIRGDSFNDRIEHLHSNYNGKVRTQDFYQLLEEFICICNAVSYAHSQGIVHCDLKPENVGVGEFGEITVLDWGLAHRFNSTDTPSRLLEESISGTPNYLSPEQAQGVRESLTPATDIYSLGAILFEMLFNRPPRRVDDHPTSLQALLNSVIKGEIPRAADIAPSNARVIASICDKCLATLPENRYASVQELIDDLYRWRDDERVHAAPNPITKQVARTVRRHQRTTIAAFFILIVATIVTAGFYTAVTSSQHILNEARNSERKQQTNIDQQQIALTTAIADAVNARREAETGERDAQFQTAASTKATLEHQMARALAIDATQRATTQQRKAALATNEADRQTKRLNMSREALELIRVSTEQLSYQRQLEIESGYTDTAMQLAVAGDFQTALAWARVSRDHAISIQRSPVTLAEHQIRIMALRNQLPNLIGYQQLSKTPALTSISKTAHTIAAVSLGDSPQNTSLHLFRSGSLEELHPALMIGLTASAITFSPDGHFLIITGHQSGSPMANELLRISLLDFTMVRSKLVIPDAITTLTATNDRIIIGTETGYLHTYALGTLKLQHSIAAHTDAITTLSISPDLSMSATGSLDASARIWELETLAPLTTSLRHKSPVIGVRFSNTSNTVVTTERNGFSLAWNTSLFLTKPRTTRGPAPSAEQIARVTAHHPAELLMAIGTDAGAVRVFNAPGSDFIAPLIFSSSINTLTFSNDGRLLIIGTAAGHLSIYDFSQRQMIYDKVSHLGSITSVHLSQNNQFLTVFSSNGQIQLWDLAQPNLSPTQLSVGNESSSLRLNASHSALLFVTNNSTLNETTTDSHFSQVSSELLFESNIDQVFLSPYTANGFVITQHKAHPIVTSKLQSSGAAIDFAGEIIDVTISPTNQFALSSADRTIKVGHFKGQRALARITAHKIAARFVRFNRDSSALVTFGSPAEESGNRVIQIVSIADNSVLNRIVVPFAINSVSGHPLVDSNELLLTTVSGESWRLDRDSLAYSPYNELPNGAREIINHSKRDLLLARDDTVVVVQSKPPAKRYPSRFQTNYTSYSEDFNWLLRANGLQFSIQSTDTGHQVCPAVTVPNVIRDAMLVRDGELPLVLIATEEGVYRYSIQNTRDASEFKDVNLTLLSGSHVNAEKQLVQLSHDDIAKLLPSANLTPTTTQQPLNWLRRYSTVITPNQWQPWIDHLRTELAKLSGSPDNPIERTLISELQYALLAAGHYKQVINELHSAKDGKVKSTYQAVVLSAWIGDRPLYNQTLRSLLQNADPRVPQHFVYLLNGLSLAPHNFPTESLIKSLDRLPDRLANNSFIQRGQLAIAIFRDDKLMATDILAKLDKPGVSLPIRIYCKLAKAWLNPQVITELELQQLQHQIEVRPALQSGNPGKSWEERCLLDLLLRRLTASHKTPRDGETDEPK